MSSVKSKNYPVSSTAFVFIYLKFLLSPFKPWAAFTKMTNVWFSPGVGSRLPMAGCPLVTWLWLWEANPQPLLQPIHAPCKGLLFHFFTAASAHPCCQQAWQVRMIRKDCSGGRWESSPPWTVEGSADQLAIDKIWTGLVGCRGCSHWHPRLPNPETLGWSSQYFIFRSSSNLILHKPA